MAGEAVSYGVIAGIGGAALLCIGSFVYGVRVGGDSVEAQKAREERVARVAGEAAQKAAAEAISKIEVKNVTQRQILQREIVREPVYRDCRHSEPGVRAINDALVPDNADRGAVRPADPAR